MKTYLANIARILLGLLLIAYSLIKAIDPIGASIAMAGYLEYMFGQEFALLAVPLTLALLAIEFTLGIALIFRFLLDFSIPVTFLLSFGYLIVSLSVISKDFYQFCGCGWELIFYNKKVNLYINFLLAFLSIVVFAYRKTYRKSRILEKYQLSWLLTALLLILMVVFVDYTFLSIIDITPYKTGTDLRKKLVKVQYVDSLGREHIGYELRDSSCFPKLTKVLSPYCQLSCRFDVINQRGQNLTDSLLHESKPLLLIIAYDLDKMNLKGFTKIVRFARQFNDRFGSQVYCLTSSSWRKIDSIVELTGAYDIEFCQAPQKTLKMFIRSNPGVIVLKHGIIVAKRNYNTLPNLKKERFYRKKIKPYEQ